MGKFQESLSSGLAEKWLATLLTPAFVFWAGGGALLIVRRWSWREAFEWFSGLDVSAMVAFALSAFVLVSVSAVVVQRFDMAVIRSLEGYWPAYLSWFRKICQRRLSRRLAKDEREYQELARRRRSAEEEWTYQELDARLRWVPSEESDRMPTRLGNVLRTAERRPAAKYGLDAVIWWPRLWFCLPEGLQDELADARAALDADARVFFWGLLALGWSFVDPWIAIAAALLTMLLAYRSMLISAENYGQLFETAFDLYRRKLYDLLAWPVPSTPREERETGRALTQYILRGSDEPTPVFSFSDRGEEAHRSGESDPVSALSALAAWLVRSLLGSRGRL